MEGGKDGQTEGRADPILQDPSGYHRGSNNDANNYGTNNKTTTSTSFEFKTKLIVSTPNNNSRLNAEVVLPLK